MSCGVPQGSILGSTLWNIFYDRILKTTVEKGVTLVAYADDLAMVVTGKNKEALTSKVQDTMRRITRELGEMDLEVAVEKLR